MRQLPFRALIANKCMIIIIILIQFESKKQKTSITVDAMREITSYIKDMIP